jgi:hypothetical protein
MAPLMKFGQWSALVIAHCCGAQMAAISLPRSDRGKVESPKNSQTHLIVFFWPILLKKSACPKHSNIDG